MNTATSRKRLERRRAHLQELRSRFGRGVDDVAEHSYEELSSHDNAADLGSELFEREKQFSILEMLDGEIADVEVAFQRLADGTYRVCDVCGRRIPDVRLEAKPETRYCVQDRARAERTA